MNMAMVDTLLELLANFPKLQPRPRIFMSPGVKAELFESTQSNYGSSKYDLLTFGGPVSLYGIEIIESRNQLTKQHLVSNDPFVEYDESDADWAVPLGLARWETRDIDAMCLTAERRAIPQLLGDVFSGRETQVPA